MLVILGLLSGVYHGSAFCTIVDVVTRRSQSVSLCSACELLAS